MFFRFRNRQANCIIATDVIEEGVDIPDCTLVVRYDLPMDIRSYIQSKGRARHATSKYVLLVSNDDGGFGARYNNYRLIEKKLEQVNLYTLDMQFLEFFIACQSQCYFFPVSNW